MHYQDNTPVLDDEVQWIIEIPLTYIQNLDDERCVQEGRFVNDGRFSWECDTAPGDLPMFYLGRKTCYGREIFTGNYAIRKQMVICYVPKECSISELKDMVVREIEMKLHEILEQNDYGEDAGLKFMDTRQLTDYLVSLK